MVAGPSERKKTCLLVGLVSSIERRSFKNEATPSFSEEAVEHR